MKQQVKISTVKGNPNNPRIIKNDKFNFWQEYQKSVDDILDTDESIISNHQFISDKEKNNQMQK